MEIKINGIGIIKDSTIKLDGLTVISGKNNSGKSSVGKVVYSVFRATENVEEQYRLDRRNYFYKLLQDLMYKQLSFFDFFLPPFLNEQVSKDFSIKNPNLFSLISNFGLSLLQREENRKKFDPEDLAKKVLHELKDLDVYSFHKDIKDFFMKELDINDEDKVLTVAKEKIDLAIKRIEKGFEFINSDPNLIDYVRTRIDMTLNREFNNQIQPVSGIITDSFIQITEGEQPVCDIKVLDNKVKNTGRPVFYRGNNKRALLVDDPYIIDNLYPPMVRIRPDSLEGLVSDNNLQHSLHLRKMIAESGDNSVLEQLELDESTASIRKIINTILPGFFKFSNSGNFYVNQGKELALENLATGSKFFSILKILLEKGCLKNQTILILDEPECHLHPEWINILAEVIVLLVKYENMDILLTTHNTNLVLAIEAFMRKYDIIQRVNFYQTKENVDSTVSYEKIYDLETIYNNFLTDMLNAKNIRDEFLYVKER